MFANSSNAPRIPAYVWAALAVAVVLILGSFWWADSPNRAATGRAEAARVVAPTGDAPQGRCGNSLVTAPLPGLPSPADVSASSGPRVQVEPVVPKAKKMGPAERSTRRSGAVSVRDMFPVGSIVVGAPRVGHPFRRMPELYPSFSYGGKLWSPTGRFAYSGQVQLASTGRTLSGRKLYALADTVGPGTALFVQSADDSDRFAIYR